jgi:hypothetical protein
VTPTRYERIGFSLPRVAQRLLKFCGIVPQIPSNRNEVIRARYADGEGISDLANIFDLSPQRIFQIVKSKNH